MPHVSMEKGFRKRRECLHHIRGPLESLCHYNQTISKPYHLKFLKGWLPQNLLSPLLNTLSHMSLSPTKSHYMYLGKNKGNYTFNFKNMSLKNSKKEVLLGLAIDNKLSLDNQLLIILMIII